MVCKIKKKFILRIKAPPSGIHVGKILIKSGNVEKEIFILINVRSEKKLFDISITLAPVVPVVAVNTAGLAVAAA